MTARSAESDVERFLWWLEWDEEEVGEVEEEEMDEEEVEEVEEDEEEVEVEEEDEEEDEDEVGDAGAGARGSGIKAAARRTKREFLGPADPPPAPPVDSRRICARGGSTSGKREAL